jgi:hypothetical protein
MMLAGPHRSTLIAALALGFAAAPLAAAEETWTIKNEAPAKSWSLAYEWGVKDLDGKTIVPHGRLKFKRPSGDTGGQGSYTLPAAKPATPIPPFKLNQGISYELTFISDAAQRSDQPFNLVISLTDDKNNKRLLHFWSGFNHNDELKFYHAQLPYPINPTQRMREIKRLENGAHDKYGDMYQDEVVKFNPYQGGQSDRQPRTITICKDSYPLQ